MSEKIVINPVTRVEGHGKVTIHLNEQGRVEDAFFHIVEFRGFEKFVQGRPYWEAPVLVQRLCGICPVSHHLAAAKAIDQIVGIEPEDLPRTATQIRRLLHYAQIFQSHALHFFYLASPDLLFGLDAPIEKRNIAAVAMEYKELALRGILMRKFGQELIQAIAGKKIHGIAAVPGGVQKAMTRAEVEMFQNGQGEHLPSIDTMIQWSLDILAFIRQYHTQNRTWLDVFAAYPSGHLGMVGANGAMELYHGKLRAINENGNITLADIPTNDYNHYFAEGTEKWTFLKFPYLRELGKEKGWNRVGPLARINVCDFIPTPLAEQERQRFFEFAGSKPVHRTLYFHWARLIELLHCAEWMKEILNDPAILSGELYFEKAHRNEGIGIIEAPRGTLTHHYLVDDDGKIEKCNLIVSTTHNNEPMNRATRWVAQQVLDGKKITEPLLNQIEIAIRAYDPCLSCATHAMGKMPLEVTLYNHQGEVMDAATRN